MTEQPTSDADMLGEFEEAYNGGNYSYDTFEAWSAKVWDALPRLLALAKIGADVERRRKAAETAQLDEQTYAYLKSIQTKTYGVDIDADLFAALVKAHCVYRTEDDMVGITPQGERAIAAYAQRADSGDRRDSHVL